MRVYLSTFSHRVSEIFHFTLFVSYSKTFIIQLYRLKFCYLVPITITTL